MFYYLIYSVLNVFFLKYFIINSSENDGAKDLCLNFTLNEDDCFGNHKTIELKPNGTNIDVADSNKNEYIE